ncbi:MAG TPA: triose-phosphate isomerase [Brumimicrobium sp.]|nr:triose-phosphate isomerase [Brumimicrobium sp.]
MRKKIVAGNWKMNLLLSDAEKLNTSIDNALAKNDFTCEVYQFVPYIYLKNTIDISQNVIIGAQNGHPEKNGAFTGEISMSQLSSLGTKAVLVGHSERRQLFNESNDFLKEKVNAAIAEGIKVFFCCGESLDQRESGKYEEVVIQQLKDSLFHLSKAEFKNIVIAYEPIWAIGTGKTASPEQANDMHKSIRNAIANAYSTDIAERTSILYGGSCNPSNAQTLLSQTDIDGGLIGGASLKSEDFISIISTYK